MARAITLQTVTAILLLALTSLSQAASVLPLGLERLLADAETVFNGRCIANQVERDTHTNLVVTYTSFEVIDVVKGNATQTHTIKQIGGQLPDEVMHMRWPGIPVFTVGEEYVVFLPPKSSAGFSSPVGLGQGKFTVLAGKSGKQVSNGKDFGELTKNIAPRHMPLALTTRVSGKHKQSEISTPTITLQEFMTTLRSMESSP